MSDRQAESDNVKDWLRSRIGKIIPVGILQRENRTLKHQVVWEGSGKVIRCVNLGVVLDLQVNHANSWLNKVLQAFRFLGVKYVVRPWDQKRLSVPYEDLSLDVNVKTGETRLMIDAVTWSRSAGELGQGNVKNTKG